MQIARIVMSQKKHFSNGFQKHNISDSKNEQKNGWIVFIHVCVNKDSSNTYGNMKG